MNLPALAAATISPRIPVQEMAVARLRTALTVPGSTLSAANADVDSLLPLLNSLAATNAAEIASLVPQITAGLPDDPRLVEPLWRCLTAPGIEERPECCAIVLRLLDLVMDPNSLEELGRQNRYDREFLSDDIRRESYPFSGCLDKDHNLVTLLAWASRLHVTPTSPNRFFQARAADRLNRVQADRKRTISFSLFYFGKIMTCIYASGGAVALTVLAAFDPGQLSSFTGIRTIGLAITLPLGSFMLFLIIVLLGAPRAGAEVKSRFKHHLDLPSDVNDIGNYVMWVPSDAAQLALLLAGPILGSLGMLPLAKISPAGYAIITFALNELYWLTLLNIFSRTKRYYAYHPNEYIDIYDDPRSAHWLGVKSVPTAPTAPQTP
jgi:hypothetical protein